MSDKKCSFLMDLLLLDYFLKHLCIPMPFKSIMVKSSNVYLEGFILMPKSIFLGLNTSSSQDSPNSLYTCLRRILSQATYYYMLLLKYCSVAVVHRNGHVISEP